MKWRGILPFVRWFLIGEYNNPDDWFNDYMAQLKKEREEWFKIALENEKKKKEIK